tara:strand:+ start:530 stop:931 length:402 start_codon:yes stop_codon:yes gene_type:complete
MVYATIVPTTIMDPIVHPANVRSTIIPLKQPTQIDSWIATKVSTVMVRDEEKEHNGTVYIYEASYISIWHCIYIALYTLQQIDPLFFFLFSSLLLVFVNNNRYLLHHFTSECLFCGRVHGTVFLGTGSFAIDV